MTLDSHTLLDGLFASRAMREVFCDRGRVQGMLDFEAALARAEAELGLIPAAAATRIALYCRAECFQLELIAEATVRAGNPAIPLIAALSALVAGQDEQAARFVHFGATSQDAMDTGLVLQLRAALGLFDADLAHLGGALEELVRKFRHTLLIGRTWLQPALPITFGLKAAGWLSAIGRSRERLREARHRVLVIQFGGAAGTLASLGQRGIDVGGILARELKLGVPGLAWHSQRDRVVEVATTLGLLVGSLGKIARDISLLMQWEVAEVFEPRAPGRGGSSTLPHKHNPVGAAAILAAATRIPGLVATLLHAMPQEHERGLGGWHAEWESLPEVCLLASGALSHALEVIEQLSLDPQRMRANLASTRGVLLGEAVTLALSPLLGRALAHSLVERACCSAIEEGRSLFDVLAAQQEVTHHLSLAELDRLCDASVYLGLAEEMCERALSEYARVARGSEG